MSTQLSSFRLDPQSDLGIGGQIRAKIGLLIADEELRPGDRLPSVRALAEQLRTNVNTIRSAYARLEADGLVQTRHGVGTTVIKANADRLVPGSSRLASNTVAVLIAGLDPFYLPLLRGVEDAADEQGTLVLIADTRDSSTFASAIRRRLIARGVDGIIAVSVGGIDQHARGRGDGKRTTPIVYVDEPSRHGYAFLFDGDQAGYIATRHLLDHGHNAIGLVTPPLRWSNVNEVQKGYLRALDERRAPHLVAEVEDFAVEAGRTGMAQLLDSGDPPSAVFASAEVLAFGASLEARARGLAIPEDLALIGYADSPLAALADPPLTMVSVPSREAGVLAMQTLQSLIAGGKPRIRRTVLDVELVVRASCGSH